MPSGIEVRTFFQSLDQGQKNSVTAEDLLRVLQPHVEGVTLRDIRIFIKSIKGNSHANLSEDDIRIFLEQMGF